MLHECNNYIQSFFSPRNWATAELCSINFEMGMLANKNPSQELTDHYRGLQRPQIAAIIPEAVDCIVRKQYIVI